MPAKIKAGDKITYAALDKRTRSGEVWSLAAKGNAWVLPRTGSDLILVKLPKPKDEEGTLPVEHRQWGDWRERLTAVQAIDATLVIYTGMDGWNYRREGFSPDPYPVRHRFLYHDEFDGAERDWHVTTWHIDAECQYVPDGRRDSTLSDDAPVRQRGLNREQFRRELITGERHSRDLCPRCLTHTEQTALAAAA